MTSPAGDPGPAPGADRAVGVALRIAGTVVGLLLAFFSALWEIFLSPLYLGRVPLPVSPVLAVLTSLGLVWFTRVVTGRTGLALLPGFVWFVTMVIAANRTAAGDLLLPGNDYMGLAAILLGCAAWGLAGYRMVLAGRPAVPVAAPTPPTSTRPTSTRPTSTRPTSTRPAPAVPVPTGGPGPTGKPARSGPKPGTKPVSAGRRRPSGPSSR